VHCTHTPANASVFIYRLAYAAMPLVLAAIDLKLSPSNRETQKRQKRLDSISRIIRHSETLYDVTDFVAVGTNQILQLAYSVTRNVFLSRASHLRISPESDHQSLKVQNHHALASRVRAKSWLDAFLSCPRAYLLISTSVDYSLAVGRLPCGDSLPISVRHLSPSSGIARLPWSTGNTADVGIIREIGGNDERNCRDSPWVTSAKIVAATEGTAIEHHHLVQNGISHSRCEQGYQDEKLFSASEWHRYQRAGLKDQTSDYNPPMTVNLDFLELDGGLRSPEPSSLWHLGVSDRADFTTLAFINSAHNCLGQFDYRHPKDDLARQDATQKFDTCLY
jgi:hypothetical protein